jgi:hypothetical protein
MDYGKRREDGVAAIVAVLIGFRRIFFFRLPAGVALRSTTRPPNVALVTSSPHVSARGYWIQVHRATTRRS